jgi:hypothetical protein
MNVFDQTTIRDEVRAIIRNLGISKKVYANRPKEADPASDFVVVNISGGIQDFAAYGECVIVISLFAKDNDSFINDKKLSVMYQKLVSGFPASSGKLLFDTEWNILPDSPDDFGFHVRMIRIHTTIKAI